MMLTEMQLAALQSILSLFLAQSSQDSDTSSSDVLVEKHQIVKQRLEAEVKQYSFREAVVVSDWLSFLSTVLSSQPQGQTKRLPEKSIH